MEPIKRVSCVIGTAGHIDHGKTSLVKALTGIDTDRLVEEKKRGVSIDLGFAYLDFDGPSKEIKLRAAVVDVPGHERFIKNMLAGATGIDLVLFVIAADDGVMPQTREHLDIIHVLGIKRGIFVITKTDTATPSRVKEVIDETSGISKGTVLEGSPIIPVSSVTGEGVEGLKKLIREMLLKHSRDFKPGHLRLPIDRSFPVKGFGTVVTGTVASGSLKKGDDVVIFPAGLKAKVRGIQSLYLSADEAMKGQRAAVNLAGVEHEQVNRGDVLISQGLAFFVEKARLSRLAWQFDCVFELLGPGDYNFDSRKRRPLKVYHFTDESPCMLRISRKDGKKAYGRLSLKKPLLMMRRDRFVLRDPSINATIGGGTVLVNYPSKEMVPRIEPTGEVLEGDKATVIKAVMPPNGVAFEKDSICLMLNTAPEELIPSIEGKGLAVVGDFIADSVRVEKIRNKVIERLKAFHSANPAEEGLREDEVIKDAAKGLSGGIKRERVPVFIKALLDCMAAENILKRDKGVLSLPGHRPALAGVDGRIQASIMALFQKGISSPLPEEIKKIPFPKADVDRVFSYLLRRGDVVRLKEGVFVSGPAVAEAKAKLADHIRSKGPIKAADFRDLLGCGRKLAIEILEYFDKERVTLRQGDVRTLRQ